MMTHNLRTLTLDQLRDQDIVSKVHDDEITSTFRLRSLEPVKGQPWTYVAFGVKEVHRVHDKAEFTDRLVARYNVRLLQTERSERVPSGLLVAEYGEQQMVGEKDNGLAQSSVLMDDAKK
jgi:type I site-specific restriction endonuclease